MIARHLNSGKLTTVLRYNIGFFTKAESKDQKFKVPLFKTQEQKAEPKFEGERTTPRADLQELIKKINESNRYFLGIKLNTNYLKVNNIAKYADLAKQKIESVKISDFPIEYSKGDDSLGEFEDIDHSKLMEKKAVQVAFAHCRIERVLNGMSELIRSYIVGLTSSQRLKGLEPNFEANIIKLRNSLKDKVQFQLHNQNELPQVKIQNVSLLRGVSVNRNDNYSTDSYSKDQAQINQGITTYTLYRQRKQRYPQEEWASTKKINARFEVLVKGGPYLQVKEGNKELGSTANVIHSVVIEANLVPPPAISEYQMTSEQSLRSYRVRIADLTITNFDRKNNFYPLTYSESQKQTALINQIQ